MTDENGKRVSISLRLQRARTEYAYVAVPVVSGRGGDAPAPHPEGSGARRSALLTLVEVGSGVLTRSVRAGDQATQTIDRIVA